MAEQVKEHPIPFSAPMVRALLNQRKSQTRRVLSPSNSFFGSASREFWQHCDFEKAFRDGVGSGTEYLHVPCHVEAEGVCDRCDEMGWAGSFGTKSTAKAHGTATTGYGR